MGIKFIFDENIGPNISNALRLIGYDVGHVLDTFQPRTKDVVILKYVGENKYALITKDKHIRRNPNEKAKLIEYKVVAFFLGGKQMSSRDIHKQLTKAWDKMEAKAKTQLKKGMAGAFIVNRSGGSVDELPLT